VNVKEEVKAVRQIVSEALIGRLAEWGVDIVFGIPGDGINGIMEGLRSCLAAGQRWQAV
jgi:thiamine pyrophosphate-dependent acetolactate synthase large subunit-like protein